VVIHNLHSLRAACSPAKANSELIIDADAPLPRAVAFKLLQPVVRRHAQIIYSPSHVQLFEFSARHRLDIPESGDAAATKQRFRVSAAKTQDHGLILAHYVSSVKCH